MEKYSPKRPRVKKEEKIWREDIVYDYHIWGFTEYEILQKVNAGGDTEIEKGLNWGVGLNSISRYLNAAIKRRRTQRDITDTLELLRESKKRWHSIIKTAKDVGNIENVRLCQKELDRLNGLEKVTINLNINDIRNKSDEELLQELEHFTNASKKK